jgi:hypothetical protein
MLVMAYPSLEAGPKLPPIQARPSRSHHLHVPLRPSRTRTMRKTRNLTALYISFPPRDVRTNPGEYPQFPHYGEKSRPERGTALPPLETASINRVNVRKRWNYNRRAHAAPRASVFGLDGDSNLKSRS